MDVYTPVSPYLAGQMRTAALQLFENWTRILFEVELPSKSYRIQKSKRHTGHEIIMSKRDEEILIHLTGTELRVEIHYERRVPLNKDENRQVVVALLTIFTKGSANDVLGFQLRQPSAGTTVQLIATLVHDLATLLIEANAKLKN